MAKYMNCLTCGMVWDILEPHPRPYVQNPGPSCPYEGETTATHAKDAAGAAQNWVEVEVAAPRVDVVADLERRIEALELAHEQHQSASVGRRRELRAEIADIERRALAAAKRTGADFRAAIGLLVDVAAPARKVIAFVDSGRPDPSPTQAVIDERAHVDAAIATPAAATWARSFVNRKGLNPHNDILIRALEHAYGELVELGPVGAQPPPPNVRAVSFDEMKEYEAKLHAASVAAYGGEMQRRIVAWLRTFDDGRWTDTWRADTRDVAGRIERGDHLK